MNGETIQVKSDLEKAKALALRINIMINNDLPDTLPSNEQMANVVAALYICIESYIGTFQEYGFKFIKKDSNTVLVEQ